MNSTLKGFLVVFASASLLISTAVMVFGLSWLMLMVIDVAMILGVVFGGLFDRLQSHRQATLDEFEVDV